MGINIEVIHCSHVSVLFTSHYNSVAIDDNISGYQGDPRSIDVWRNIFMQNEFQASKLIRMYNNWVTALKIGCLLWSSSKMGHEDFQNKPSGLWFNIKMSSFQYRKSHCRDRTVVDESYYLHNGISYTHGWVTVTTNRSYHQPRWRRPKTASPNNRGYHQLAAIPTGTIMSWYREVGNLQLPL